MTTERSFFHPDPAWLPDNEVGIPRDSKDRPMIVPPCPAAALKHQAGVDRCPECPTEPVPYERISRVGGWTDSLEWLMDWRLGHLALGLSRSPDLCHLAAAFDGWNDPRMGAVVERAHDRAGGNVKADWGTAMHAHTDPGADPERVPEDMRLSARAYHLAMKEAGVRVVRHEVFVVCDLLRVAGTLDYLGLHDDLGLHVGDKKTGHYKAMPFAIQLACYANSEGVLDMDDLREGRWAGRHPLSTDPATGEDYGPMNTERGVVAHVPKPEAADGFGSKPSHPRATLRKVDIERGWAAAQRACEVREDQASGEWTDPEPLGKVTRGQVVDDAIATATSRDDLRALQAAAGRYMTKPQRAAANARWLDLR